MRSEHRFVFKSGMVIALLLLFSTSGVADTDGDGLLDLVDVPGFDPNVWGAKGYNDLGIQDLDGANLLTNVDGLYLRQNRVTSIESGDFEGVPQLQTLDISANRITRLENGVFHGLTNLRTLNLQENQITSIEHGAFDGLTNLQTLDLQENHITSIENGVFGGLEEIQNVNLAGNFIANIENGDFAGLHSLQSLDLGNNAVVSIEADAFNGLGSLRELHLSGNLITSIERHHFNELESLQYLDLSGNLINTMENNNFRGLHRLRSLNLTGNPIIDFHSGAFNGMHNLESLTLGHIDDNNGFQLNLSEATFENLRVCSAGPGFCVFGVDMLILDGATVSSDSFRAIYSSFLGIEHRFRDISLVGVNFSDPVDLTEFFAFEGLEKVTVDQQFYDRFRDEFEAFALRDNNVVTVLPGLCDYSRDGFCDVADIDAITAMVMSGAESPHRRSNLITRLSPDGLGTYFGDSNLDGEFNSGDFVSVFLAGQFEDGIPMNSTWREGDWNGDGDFDTVDFVSLFQHGGYERGPRATQVPEPYSIIGIPFFVFLIGQIRIILKTNMRS